MEANECKLAGVGLSGQNDWRSLAEVTRKKSDVSPAEQIMIFLLKIVR